MKDLIGLLLLSIVLFIVGMVFISLNGCSKDNGATYSYANPIPPGCTVTQDPMGTYIDCGTTSAFIPTYVGPISPVGIITPCGAASSPWKEVLICLSNGGLLSSFSETMSGQDTRLAIIPDGSYIDTDESGCNFTVSSTLNMRTVSWNAGTNAYSTWPNGSSQCIINP